MDQRKLRLLLTLTFLFVTSVAANIWLWGHWSFMQQPPWLSAVFITDSALILFMLVFPAVYGLRHKSFRGLGKLWVCRIAYVLLVVLTIILAIDTFWWMRVYFLPVQITFVIINSYLFLKKRGWLPTKSSTVNTKKPQ